MTLTEKSTVDRVNNSRHAHFLYLNIPMEETLPIKPITINNIEDNSQCFFQSSLSKSMFCSRLSELRTWAAKLMTYEYSSALYVVKQPNTNMNNEKSRIVVENILRIIFIRNLTSIITGWPWH